MKRMTLDIDRKLLEEVVWLTGEKTMSRAVNRAMEAFVRRKRIEELRSVAGKEEMAGNLKELEELEKLEIREWEELNAHR